MNLWLCPATDARQANLACCVHVSCAVASQVLPEHGRHNAGPLLQVGLEGRPDPHWLTVLRWVFGGVVCTQNTEALERQTSLLGTTPGAADSAARSSAIAELYDELGDAWRRYQRHMDRKRKTTHLTCVQQRKLSPAVLYLTTCT